ncbi:MAG: DUF1549 domain-containing protein, partial [Planctomycetes bacterium]|nr:DUF1549 domain-containing protein [Planctomycetota bacterium]
MKYSVLGFVSFAITVSTLFAADRPTITGDLRVEPTTVKLAHRRQPQSLIVTGQTDAGLTLDLTATANYTSSNEKVARVNSLGWVQPVGSGSAEIRIESSGKTATVNVSVALPEDTQPYSFRRDVMPVLSKAGCNAGACHGYSLGKNGFKLSLRGSDPDLDYKVLTDEFFQRRINPHTPPASLLLVKPLGDIPHQGGVRFEHGSLLHEQLLGWVREGARPDPDSEVRFESIRIYPEKVVMQPGWQQQLQVTARYSDGSTRDVTRLSIFTVNTQRVASVTDEGLVAANSLGETAVSARFERSFATSRFIVLQPKPNFQPLAVPEGNLIDKFVVRKLNDLNIRPSELADDATFLRRVFTDLIGIQPAPEELFAFLADQDPNKRTRVIDELFRRPEFVDQWSLKWGDLLQNSRAHLSEPAVFAFREQIRGAIASNKPLDQFVREILTSQGGVADNPLAAYFVVSKDPHDTLQRATQVFCGVRMLCAKCHPHPFENWTQADYYGLYNFFNQVTTKNDPRLPGVKNAKTVLLNLGAGYQINPRTGQQQPPRFLGGAEPKIEGMVDRREVYAAWLTAPENPHFARSMTNRIWSYFFHRGIIDPVDDLRSTNPPINPELLDGLTANFVEHKFDVQHLMRTIVTSRTYQLSSVTNETNQHDDMNFSRAVPRRLPAETLLDCLVQAT